LTDFFIFFSTETIWPMKPNLVGCIYGRSSIKIAHFVPIHLQIWLPQAILVSFRDQPIRNKNCLWWPCLLTDRDKMSNRNRGLSIDTSYQVSVHLAKRFQRRRFFYKIFSSEIALPNEPKLGRMHLWEVLY
jgi:hypothetical protein